MTSSKKEYLLFKRKDPIASVRERYLAITSRHQVFESLKFKSANYDESLDGIVFSYHLRNSNVLEILFLKSEICFKFNDFPWLPLIIKIKILDDILNMVDEMYRSYKTESTMCMLRIFLMLRKLKPQDLGHVIYRMRLDYCITKCYDALTVTGHGIKAKILLEDAKYWTLKDE